VAVKVWAQGSHQNAGHEFQQFRRVSGANA
jgi:hypothetical protein